MRFSLTMLFVLLAGSGAACAQLPDAAVRINQIQVIGSHNSYHAGLSPGVKAVLTQKNPKAARSLEYSHPALTTQLNNGVRQLELDIFSDKQGGRFSHLAADAMISQAGLPPDPPYDPGHEMDKPGFKVMHVAGIDQRSNCALLTACLREVQAWSKAHPQHVPLFLLIEAKQEKAVVPGAADGVAYTSEIFDDLDAEIRSVFSREELITPDDVRGGFPTLPEALAQGGWPTLEVARGKVVFLLDNRALTPVYSLGHPALRGRVLFTNSAADTPESAFTEQNDGTEAEIVAAVKQGMLVRTRTDEGTEAARTNDTARRELALRSGAQLVSTDYPAGEKSQWSEYIVTLPGGVAARCNPVNAPKACVSGSLER